MRRNQKGMSLVEIIIVIALIGILAGTSVSMIGQIRYANTKKAVESVGTALSRQRVTAMSKTGVPYLYIYKLDDGYYMRQLNDDCVESFEESKFNTDGIKLCGNNAEIYIDSESGTKVEGTVFIRIAYTKNGVFDTGTAGDGTVKTNVEKIVIKGSGTYTISLISTTGKYFIS